MSEEGGNLHRKFKGQSVINITLFCRISMDLSFKKAIVPLMRVITFGGGALNKNLRRPNVLIIEVYKHKSILFSTKRELK